MIAAIYARKSTEQDGDAEDRSCPRQVANARAFAEARGWTVDEAHI
jgi:DNA invertase Pin-like site-specific DNA recombinase